MTFYDTLIRTFTNDTVVGTISSTLIVIGLGYIARYRQILDANTSKIISQVVMKLALPALALTAFIKPIQTEAIKQSLGMLIWGIAIYMILIFLTPVFYLRYPKDRRTSLSVLSIFGSTTFFAIPIISAIYGDEGTIYANIFNIGYRMFLYTWAYVAMSGLQFTKKNLKEVFGNLIVVATFLGLFTWLGQDFLPQVKVGAEQVSFLRIDVTAPWLYQPLKYLSSLSTPLSWLAIGCQLAEVDFKEALKHKLIWYYSFIKIILVPIINMVGVFLLKLFGLFDFNLVALAVTVIMMATPTSTVTATYSINFDRETQLTAEASLLSTIIAICTLPLWILVLQELALLHLF
ncbi:AEC family transporter [Vaginisenegalia massiliensis]|uniref:AEC family transporter n=1 Tax=Vaginisenegalia massiliensis TaxID=2058294 RepID=UPI003B9684F9